MWRDIRRAARALAAAPTFTLAATLALALAIGANGAIFGLVDALWFRPPGVRDGATVVRIFATTQAEQDAPWSWPEFQEIQRQSTTLEDVAVRGRRGATMTAADGSRELLLVNVVSTNFFQLLGVTAALGRVFSPSDERSLQADQSVVLGHAFWQTHFGGDPSVIGRSVQLGRDKTTAVTILGVLPATFRDLEASADRDLWLPPQTWLRIGADREEFERRDIRWFEMVARRRADAPVERIDSELKTMAAAFASENAATSAGRGARAVSDAAYRLERGDVAAKALLALVLLVVLISCVNVANLLLARAAARAQEVAVRMSLGAPRWRIIRELGCENVLLGAVGALAGLIFASWLIRLLPTLMAPPPGMRAMVAYQTDVRVVLFTAGVAALTTVLFGLAPAWVASRTDLVAMIRSASGATSRDGTVRRGLVVTQTAISVVLLVVAASLGRSFVAASRSDLGFARKPLLTLWTTFGTHETVVRDEAVRRLEALPGVRGVAVAIRAPLSLSGGGMAQPVTIDGAAEARGAPVPLVKFNAVSWNYFDVLGTRLVAGRAFSYDEERNGEPPVIVNEQFVLKFLPGRAALDAIVRVRGAAHRIVGIAQDGVVNEVGEPPQAYMYLPFARGRYGETTFILETAAGAASVGGAARAVLKGLDPALEPRRQVTMTQYVNYATSLHRLTAALGSILGLVGLLLTSIGVYGVITYRTSRRAKEIGIRMALGAHNVQILRLVMSDGLVLGVLGVMAGLPLAFGATRLVASMLIGIDPWDAVAWLTGVGLLLLCVGLATAIPARRATLVQVAKLLRSVPH